MELTLDGQVGPETAGLVTANELGYLKEAGIELTISTPLAPDRTTSYVAEGVVDVGIAHEPQVVLAQEEGKPIVAIGSLFSEPTLSMIWLEKSEIDDIADLKGKTIAYPGVPFQKELLKSVLEREGLTLSDVKLEWTGYEVVQQLLNGHADAIFGGSWNVEGAALEAAGAKPVIIRPSELDLPPYNELVAIARKDRVAKDPELFRRFMEAVERGTAAAIEDPGTTTEAVAEAAYDISYQTIDLKATEAGLEVTLPLLPETGSIDSKQTSDLIDWMHEEGLIQQELPVSALVAEP
jgi:putative hydroxymethylpyrimidine transport system substrate-binding protein